MFLTENLKIPTSASIAFDRSNALGLSPNPYYKQKEQEKKETNPSILALFVFMDDMMLSHHELASP